MSLQSKKELDSSQKKIIEKFEQDANQRFQKAVEKFESKCLRSSQQHVALFEM
jgi:uncharacterized protein YukE